MDSPGSNKPSLLERLSTMLLREPEDREQLVALLHSAYERNLLDADALSMMEGDASLRTTGARNHDSACTNGCHRHQSAAGRIHSFCYRDGSQIGRASCRERV